jgi:hypothetical protein
MKKILVFISVLICFTSLLAGCSNSSKPTDSNTKLTEDAGEEKAVNIEQIENKEKTEEVVTEEAVPESGELVSPEDTVILNTGEFKSICDISEYWNDLYTRNEAVINAYEGMPIMELVTPGLCFVTGVQYDLLNIENKDGHFEGELMLAGYSGVVEKKGSQITFHYDEVLEEDGFSPSMKKGDKKAETGNCDLEKGLFYADSSTERDGVMIQRSTSEFQKQEDDSMCTIVMDGRTLDYNANEELFTSYIFIRSGKDQYDFVVASSAIGTSYEMLHLKADMTKEQAISMFKTAGGAIEKSGGIVNGALVLD